MWTVIVELKNQNSSFCSSDISNKFAQWIENIRYYGDPKSRNS